MSRRMAISLLLLGTLTRPPASPTAVTSDAETRVLDYIRDHLQPGQPVLVSELYSKVFTQPEERKALNKLYKAFFRIPLFIAQYQDKFGAPPNLKIISEQFDLQTPQAAEVLLRVMEADPRVPRFLSRDPKTGEVTRVDVERVRSDPHFGQELERQLSGWEGKPAPEFRLPGLEQGELDSASLRGKSVLLYIWFTGCPPCLQETPELVALEREFSDHGLTIIGANADRILGLAYDDAVRQHYAEEQKINFPIVHWTRETDVAFGNIAIFPTLFLIDPKGDIMRHWVGYVSREELRSAIEQGLRPARPAR